MYRNLSGVVYFVSDDEECRKAAGRLLLCSSYEKGVVGGGCCKSGAGDVSCGIKAYDMDSGTDTVCDACTADGFYSIYNLYGLVSGSMYSTVFSAGTCKSEAEAVEA